MFELIVALVAGLAIYIVVVGLLSRPTMDPVQARLTSYSSGPAQTLEQLELQRPLFDRTLRPLIDRFSGLSQRLASPRRVSRTEKRLAMAGYPGGMRTIDFLGLKILFAGVVWFLTFILMGVIRGQIVQGILLASVLAAVVYLATEIWLIRRAKSRQRAILRSVPDSLDLLTISVRAGLGFDAALAKVVEKSEGPLADEFSRALAEIRVGRPRRDALRDILNRTDVPPLAAFVGAIIQAEELGVPIARVLQVQSEQLRIERRQRAEELAAKAPIKMLFPLVGCIFPSMFIVILGPAIILIMKTIEGI